MGKNKKTKADVGNWLFTVADHVTMTIHKCTKAEAISHFRTTIPGQPYFVRKTK